MEYLDELSDLLNELGIEATDDQLNVILEKIEMKRRTKRPFKKGVAADKHKLSGSKYLARYGYGKRSPALRKTLHVGNKPRRFKSRGAWHTLKNDTTDALQDMGAPLNELELSTYKSAADKRFAASNKQHAAGQKKEAKKSLVKWGKLTTHALGREGRVANTPKTKYKFPKKPSSGGGILHKISKFIARGKMDPKPTNEETLAELNLTTYKKAADQRRDIGYAHAKLGNKDAAQANHDQSHKIQAHAAGREERVERTKAHAFLGKRAKLEPKFQKKTEKPDPFQHYPKPEETPKPKRKTKKITEQLREAVKKVRTKQDNPDIRLTPMVHGIQAGMSMKAEEFTTVEE